MESKTLVICDPEEGYAQALALYLMRRTGSAFQVQVYDCARWKGKADVLVISSACSLEERRQIEAGQVFVITDNMKSPLNNGEIPVYKYQSGEKILTEMVKHCEYLRYGSDALYRGRDRKKGKVIGVFSPVHRIGKTTYALKLGEKLAAEENVLYLNLEMYGGIGGHFKTKGESLTDLLYYFRQEKANLGLLLSTMVFQKGNLDYIRPVAVSQDLKEVAVEELMELVQRILEQSIYETVVLDIDEGISKVYELLRFCTEIHFLANKTKSSAAKIRQFEAEAGILGYEDILSKMIRKDVGA